MKQELKIQKGNVLIGKPNILGDSTFNRAVILIVDYNNDGVVGFIINKPTTENLNELIPEIEKDFKIFDGGPVEKDKLYFIHSRPDLITGGINISDNLFWGGNYKNVISLINSSKIKVNEIKFFLGYSGWADIQLREEIKNQVWLLQEKIDPEELINCDKPSFWNEKVKSIGGEFLIWSNAPDNFNYN